MSTNKKESKRRHNKNGLPYIPCEVKDWDRLQIVFSAWDTHTNKLIRKRITSIPGATKAEKLRNAREIARDTNKMLKQGFTFNTGKAPVEEAEENPSVYQAMKRATEIKKRELGPRSHANYHSFFNIISDYLQASGQGRRDMKLWDRVQVLSLPFYDLGQAQHICVQIDGNSMEERIQHLDYVVCSKLESPDWLQPGYVYVFVTEYGVMCKRLADWDGDTLKLSSDNPVFKEINLFTSQVIQIWQAKYLLSSNFPFQPPIDLASLNNYIRSL